MLNGASVFTLTVPNGTYNLKSDKLGDGGNCDITKTKRGCGDGNTTVTVLQNPNNYSNSFSASYSGGDRIVGDGKLYLKSDGCNSKKCVHLLTIKCKG